MKFCTNCGTKVEENSAFCVNCGAPLKAKQEEVMTRDETSSVATQTMPVKSGAATASMVLGIIAIIVGLITFLISVSVTAYMSSSVSYRLYNTYSNSSENIAVAIGIVFLPAVLSIIGFSLALGSRGKVKNGANTAGLVLNIITIVLCVLQVIMIVSA